MKIKQWAGSALALALLGLGIFIGNGVGTGAPFPPPLAGMVPSAAVGVPTPPPDSAQSTTPVPGNENTIASAMTASITQQVEPGVQAAIPGNTSGDPGLQDQTSTSGYNVVVPNGDGALVDRATGVVITGEAANPDQEAPAGGGSASTVVAAPGLVPPPQVEQVVNPDHLVDHRRTQDQKGTLARQDAPRQP